MNHVPGNATTLRKRLDTNMHKQVNWAVEEAKAKAMPEAEIHATIADLLGSLEAADAFDRGAWSNGSDGGQGGYYRDLLSVYRLELRARERNTKARKKEKLTLLGASCRDALENDGLELDAESFLARMMARCRELGL